MTALIARLVLFAAILFQLPARAQSVGPTPTTPPPTLAERLDRLAAEFDRNRIDLHVPGAALAIVRGEEVIFARGFGVADLEKNTRVPGRARRNRRRTVAGHLHAPATRRAARFGAQAIGDTNT